MYFTTGYAFNDKNENKIVVDFTPKTLNENQQQQKTK